MLFYPSCVRRINPKMRRTGFSYPKQNISFWLLLKTLLEASGTKCGEAELSIDALKERPSRQLLKLLL